MFGLVSRIFLFGLALSLCQCRWSDPPAADTIVFALSSEPKTIDPRYATDASGQRVSGLIFSSLLRRDRNLKMVGDLAESWSYQNKVYSFKLKPNIRFHNQRWAVAEDFKFSIEQFKSSRSPFSAQFSPIDKAEVSYNHQSGGLLKITLKEFSAPLIQDLPSLKLLPAKETIAAGEDFYQNPIGTGPFAYASRDIKNLFLQRFNDYHGKKAVTPKLQFKVVKDSNTRFQKMYKGKIDIIQSDVPFSKVNFFKKQKDFNVVVSPGLSMTYILLNLRHPTLKQKKVRKAISSAIKREEIIKYTHEGYAEPATSIVTPANAYFNHSLTHPKMADSEIKKTFQAFSDQPIILKTSNTQEAIENGKVLTQQLRAMGLNIEQQTYEWGTFYEDVRTGKFEMAVMKWVGVQDPDIYRVSLHSSMTPPGRNRGYYSNKEVDGLLIRGLREPDFERRKAIFTKVQQIVFDELPTIPLWYEKQIAITHKRVKAYYLPMSGDFSSLTQVYKENVDK